MSNNNNTDQTLAIIQAMCQQEENGYRTRHYLFDQLEISPAPIDSIDRPVSARCRQKMVTWCYQLVDHCKLNRNTVAIAMNYLDRFLDTPEGFEAKLNRTVFQLASMTSLYTAIKLHSPIAIDPKLIADLSRGTYSIEQVEAMEFAILSALGWRMNPPTALAFVRYFLELIPADVLNVSMAEMALDMAKVQIELSVHEYELVTVKSSTIAFVALMNSLESLVLDDRVLGNIGFTASKCVRLNVNSKHVNEVHDCLYRAILKQPACALSTTNVDAMEADECSSRSRKVRSPTSPRSFAVSRQSPSR